jgi:predicted transcriptional regulator
MKVYELIGFNRELLERIHTAGIRLDDYKYADLYAEYQSLVASGEKVTYAVATLSARYGISERQVYNLLGKFNREITYCTSVAVE